MISDHIEAIISHPDGDQSGQGVALAPRRRQESRFSAFQRTVWLQVDSYEIQLLLNNLSLHGASGRVTSPLVEGQRLNLVFENGHGVGGTVRWVKGDVVGIQFSAPLAIDLLEGSHMSTVKCVRERRYSVARKATILHDSASRPALIRNVSRSGLLVQISFALMPGRWIELRCGTLEPLQCQIRWSQRVNAGLLLASPISLEEFELKTACSTF